MPSDAYIPNVMLLLFFSGHNANQTYERMKEVCKEVASYVEFLVNVKA